MVVDMSDLLEVQICFNMFQWRWTHCHLEGGQLLGVDDSLVNGVGLRQVNHFAERGGENKYYQAVKDEITIR